jgi:hypothetical protein
VKPQANFQSIDNESPMAGHPIADKAFDDIGLMASSSASHSMTLTPIAATAKTSKPRARTSMKRVHTADEGEGSAQAPLVSGLYISYSFDY